MDSTFSAIGLREAPESRSASDALLKFGAVGSRNHHPDRGDALMRDNSYCAHQSA